MTFFIMIKFWIIFFIFSILKSFQTQTYKIHIWSHSCNNYIKYELIYLQTEKIQIWHRDFIPGLSTTVKTTEWRFEGIRYKKNYLIKITWKANEKEKLRIEWTKTNFLQIFIHCHSLCLHLCSIWMCSGHLKQYFKVIIRELFLSFSMQNSHNSYFWLCIKTWRVKGAF